MAAFVFIVALASLAASADPFSDLTKDGNDACFRRVYDAAHLRKNPRQQTISMTVWLGGRRKDVGANVGLAVVRRGDLAPLFLSAACQWEE